MPQSHHKSYESCTHSSQISGSTLQTLEEVEFEGGMWVVARDGEGAQVMDLLGRETHPSVQDTSGYRADLYAAGWTMGILSR